MVKKYLDFKFSEFTTNKNFNFSRKKILKVLPEKHLLDAHKVISKWKGYKKTPLINLRILSKKLHTNNIFYKDESKRFGLKSFKALGGAYAVEKIVKNKKKVTVSTATAGNHGKSVSWGAKKIGARCKIFISENVSNTRAIEMEKLGADVIRVKGNYEKSLKVCKEISKKKGWKIIQDVAWRNYEYVPKLTMAGYSVMIKEISNQTKHYITHVFLQAGVGGMAAAVAAYTKRRYGDERPVIVLADPDQSACWLESIRLGTPSPVHGDLNTLMAGLACGEVSVIAWDILRQTADAVMSVMDDDAVAMMRVLANPTANDQAIVAGESAVAGLAALMAAADDAQARSALGLDAHSQILIFGTESDTDPDLYVNLIGRSADEVRRAS